MRRLIFLAAMSAIALARPELYKEKEDFQYSRSSSDDGTKSGFYGAQRGNMGGNYEKAHNMDNLAQHQMSGLVGQVEGELGEGAKTRTGSVYTAANSRGIYGSGNYDLSNLKGRNFEEGESYGSQSHSSLASQSSGYRGQAYSGQKSAGFSSRNSQSSRYSGYQSSSQVADHRQADNLQAIDMSQGIGGYESNSQAGRNIRYHSQFGSQGQSEFDQSSTNLHASTGYGSNAHTRYVAATPNLRLVVRPGARVVVPIPVQTYDFSQSALSEDKTALNSDAEVLDHQINYKPTNKVKHYESSYSYRKEWEKHNTQPADVSVVVPTENPYPKNSELYEDAQLLQASNSNLNLAQSSRLNSAYSASTKSASSSQSRLQSGLNYQQGHGADYYANTYGQRAQNSANLQTSLEGNSAHNLASTADLSNVESLNLKPKSYQSSYSYHKSWERKGDPYVIEPANGQYNDLTSQRLTAASANRGAYSSHQFGSHSSKSHQSYAADCDCDEEGHVRVARSYNTDQELQNQQQYQNKLENLEDLGQQTQSKLENLEDLGQQTQSKWENLEDLGQQTQNQWDNLQELGQQSQGQWDNLQQLDQFGQQSQNQWDKLEDLGQQTQRGLEQQTQNENLEDFSQQSQKSEVNVPFFEQQANGEDIFELQKSHTEQGSQPNLWDQQKDFEQQVNTQTDQDFSQQISSTNKHEQNKQPDDINQNLPHLQSWFEGQDTNFDTNDFLKPIHGLSKEISEHRYHHVKKNDEEESKHFSSISSHTENTRHWNLNQNQGSDASNPSHKVGNQFWHMNEYSNINNEFNYHNLNSNINTASNIGKPLQSLWDKIDNIAGEFSTTGEKMDDKKEYTSEYSNFDYLNQNWHQMQDANSWNFLSKPTYQNSESPQINTENISTTTEANNIEQHNPFNDNKSTKSTNGTTTIRPNQNKEVKPSPRLETNSSPLSKPGDKQFNLPDHLADVGRGDIGPEDTVYELNTANKPDKTSEEIERLSLKKDENVTKLNETVFQDTQTQNESPEGTLFPHSPIRQHKLLSTLQATNLMTTTAPPVTTIKNTYKSSGRGSSQVGMHSTTEKTIELKPVSELQKPTPLEHTIESAEIPEEKQQKNFEQQFEDLGQNENIGEQLQSSWFPNENLQQSYDQQNMDQQFNVFQEHANVQEPTLQDFGQQQQDTWKPQDLQQGYDKQNMDQQFEVLQPQHNVGGVAPLQDFGHQEQEILKLKDFQHGHEPQNMNQQFEVFQPQHNLEGIAPLQDFGRHEQEILKLKDLQQEYEQQNMDQQSEDFQPRHNLEVIAPLQDFGHQEQEILKLKDFQHGHVPQNMDQQFEVIQPQHNLEGVAPLQDFGHQEQEILKLKDFQNGHEPQNMDQQFEVIEPQHNLEGIAPLQDFGRHEQEILKLKDLQQEYEQQNMDQQSEDFQQHENMQDQSQDFGQEQDYWKTSETMQSPRMLENLNKENLATQIDSTHFSQETPIPVKTESDLQSNKDAISTPVEVSTEKPGFWKNVGSKFSNAKDKVVSWFRGG